VSPAFPNPQHEHLESSEPAGLSTPLEVRTLAVEHTIRWEPAAHTAVWATAPLAAVPGIEPVVVHQRALAEIESLATAARSSAFGILYGARYRCPRLRLDYLLIEGVQPGSSADIGPDADLRSALGAIIAQLSASDVGAVGWYRCGGQGGIRISPGDAAMHAALFPEPWSVAMLRDSANTDATAAVIRLDGHRPHLIPFYELLSPESPADLNPKQTAISWSSYHTMSDQQPPDPQPPEPPPPAPAPAPAQSIERIFDEPASPPTNDPKHNAPRRTSSRLFSFRPRFGERTLALAAIALAIFAAWYATHR